MSPTHKKLLDALSDGMRHSRLELQLLIDKYCSPGNLRAHIGNLRKMLPDGELIICEVGTQGKTYYRHVRMLKNPYDGKT